MTAPPASAGSPQETVAAAAAYLDSAGAGMAQAAAALRGIAWPAEPPPVEPPPPDKLRKSGYNTGNGDVAIDDMDKVAAWRSRPIGAYSVFNWGHLGIGKFNDSYTKPGWTPHRTIPILSHRGIMPVCTIPGMVARTRTIRRRHCSPRRKSRPARSTTCIWIARRGSRRSPGLPMSRCVFPARATTPTSRSSTGRHPRIARSGARRTPASSASIIPCSGPGPSMSSAS
jgi:hypothetical protein